MKFGCKFEYIPFCESLKSPVLHSSFNKSIKRLQHHIWKNLHVNTVLTYVMTTQPRLLAKGISTMKPWSPKTQWNKRYCRVKAGIAERTPGIPHSSCWLERSIHICAFLGFPPYLRAVVVWQSLQSLPCLPICRQMLVSVAITVKLLLCSFFLEKKKIGHYVSLGVSQPLLQYLSDLLEGSVALWKKWSHQRGEKKDWFLWVLSLIRFHAVPESLAASIH